MSAMNYSL